MVQISSSCKMAISEMFCSLCDGDIVIIDYKDRVKAIWLEFVFSTVKKYIKTAKTIILF